VNIEQAIDAIDRAKRHHTFQSFIPEITDEMADLILACLRAPGAQVAGAASALCAVCEEEFELPDEPDDEPVMMGVDRDTKCSITFGHIRRLREALAAAKSAPNARLVELLKAAKCPACDGSGSYPEHCCGGDEERCHRLCPEQVQCQWCAEKAQALSAAEQRDRAKCSHSHAKPATRVPGMSCPDCGAVFQYREDSSNGDNRASNEWTRPDRLDPCERGPGSGSRAAGTSHAPSADSRGGERDSVAGGGHQERAGVQTAQALEACRLTVEALEGYTQGSLVEARNACVNALAAAEKQRAAALVAVGHEHRSCQRLPDGSFTNPCVGCLANEAAAAEQQEPGGERGGEVRHG
jgi:hypothetical protein